jgi:hypothetical protein
VEVLQFIANLQTAIVSLVRSGPLTLAPFVAGILLIVYTSWQRPDIPASIIKAAKERFRSGRRSQHRHRVPHVDDRTKPTPSSRRAAGISLKPSAPSRERPEYFRLNPDPPRVAALWLLTCAGHVVGVLALLPILGWIPGLAGIPLGLMNLKLVRRNLARMQAGLVLPDGQHTLSLAVNLARLGLRFSVAGTLIWGTVFLFLKLFVWH